MLYGRDEQLAAVDRLLEGMRSGQAGVLVLRGEAGIGKTALLDAAQERAAGALLLRVTGVESEAELPFAALHALLRPVLDEIDTLPQRQATALHGALGMADTAVVDRFGVGLGVLSLIAELAEDRPVLVLADDAQWLDAASADALVFAARRLHAERAAVLVAARDELVDGLARLPELRLSGLGRGSAEQLLSGAGLVRAVREQLIAEAAGNPLALIELSRGLSAAERAGSVTPLALPAASPAGRVQAAFLARIAALPGACRQAVLVAALAGLADLAEVSRAIAAAGGSLPDLAAAERAGLLRVTPAGVSFSHPLVRAAAVAGSDVGERMAGHRALAGVLEDDRRAWHLAALAAGPDEEVAAELDAAAQRAGHRGSRAAMSAAYERAAVLSASPAQRGRRLALAAEAAFDAGQLPRAADLAGRAEGLAEDPASALALTWVRVMLCREAGREAEAAGFLLDGAALQGHAPPGTALWMVLSAVFFAWPVSAGPPRAELNRRAAAAMPPAGAGLLESVQALWRLQAGDTRALVSVPGPVDPRSLPEHAAFPLLRLYRLIGDLSAHRRHVERMIAAFRDAGMPGRLGYALAELAVTQIQLGDFLDAAASVAEGLGLAADTGLTALTGDFAGVAAVLAAATGDQDACQARIAQVRDMSASDTSIAAADYASAMLDLCLGRYQSALDQFQAITAGPPGDPSVALMAYPEQVEAAVRSGRPDLAARPLAQFTAWADAVGQRWASAVAARCAALTSGDDDAERHYQRAIAGHEGDGQPVQEARTRLLYGEWLRRNQRRADAREYLLGAAATFARTGARPWQERAESELRAAGAAAPAVSPADPLSRLTPQELQVVRLAAAGGSNKEIGAQLFLSPRTVGYHLYKAFPKLGVTAREELARFA
jgi:DNA-binding CsgD family transcriptional regulator/tetratricopeptide (TPR) repeat protein